MNSYTNCSLIDAHSGDFMSLLFKFSRCPTRWDEILFGSPSMPYNSIHYCCNVDGKLNLKKKDFVYEGLQNNIERGHNLEKSFD